MATAALVESIAVNIAGHVPKANAVRSAPMVTGLTRHMVTVVRPVRKAIVAPLAPAVSRAITVAAMASVRVGPRAKPR